MEVTLREERSSVQTFIFTSRSLIKAIRPKQWVKQVFVLACTPEALLMSSLPIFFKLGVLVVVFCAVASAAYLINDLQDREADRNHPTKRFRPIAAGYISIRLATVTAILLVSFAFMLSLFVGSVAVALSVGVYIIISHFYNAGLKHTPVLDVLMVGSLYTVRTAAGFIMIGSRGQGWILWSALAGCLGIALVLSKRRSELIALGKSQKTRRTLEFYAVSGRLTRYYTVTSIVTSLLFFPAAYLLAPALSSTTVLVAFYLGRMWHLVGQLKEDVHPQDIIKRDRPLLLVITCFIVAFTASILLR